MHIDTYDNVDETGGGIFGLLQRKKAYMTIDVGIKNTQCLFLQSKNIMLFHNEMDGIRSVKLFHDKKSVEGTHYFYKDLFN